ncbi:MAG: HNH endonuclease signature motif containing protein [Pseudomonadota bacterium]
MPEYVEEFPAGDGLDLLNHTGGAVSVIEGLDIISAPIPDMEQAIIIENRRNEPGTATGQGQPIRADWMRQRVIQGGAPIPEQIADRLRNREFATFDDFRGAFWKEVASDPRLAGQFNRQNVIRMADGLAPFAPPRTQVGDRSRFELDHIKPLFRGGDVYNVENLQIMTPSDQIEKTRSD